MTTCPKCGFEGQDEEACERCGIIYARMHKIMETSPVLNLKSRPGAKAGGAPLSIRQATMPPGSQPARPASLDDTASTMLEVPKIASATSYPSIAQAFPRAPTLPDPSGHPRPERRELTPIRSSVRDPAIPLVTVDAPEPKPSALPRLLVLLVIVGGLWTVVTFRSSHSPSQDQEEAVAITTTDAAWFELAVPTLIDEARRELKTIEDVKAATATRERLGARVRFLKTSLVNSPMSVERSKAIDKALDEVAHFLKIEVGAAITTLSEAGGSQVDSLADPGGKVAPVEADAPPRPTKATSDTAPLARASAAMASLPP